MIFKYDTNGRMQKTEFKDEQSTFEQNSINQNTNLFSALDFSSEGEIDSIDSFAP